MKKRFKRIASIVLTLFVAILVLAGCGKSSSSQKAQLKTPGTLTIGLEGAFAPYSYRQNGKLTGFEVELGKDLAKKAGLKVNFVPTKWDSLIAGVADKKFDLALNDIDVTKARKKNFLFTKPYIYSKYILITKNNSSIKKIQDIKGKKIGVGVGTDNETKAKKFGANTVPSSELATTIQLIEEGRIDGTINSREAFLAYKKDQPSAKVKGIVVPTSEIKPAKVAGLINKNNKGLKKKLDKALKALRKDGTLKKLSQKYFGANITKK